ATRIPDDGEPTGTGGGRRPGPAASAPAFVQRDACRSVGIGSVQGSVRRRGSKPDRQAERAELVTSVLTFELPRAQDMSIAEADIAPGEGDTELQVADQRFLVDAAAVPEGVA